MRRCCSAMFLGLMVGTAFGMMMLPQLDRKTQRNMKRAGCKVHNFAEDLYNGIMNKMY